MTNDTSYFLGPLPLSSRNTTLPSSSPPLLADLGLHMPFVGIDSFTKGLCLLRNLETLGSLLVKGE